MKPTKVRVTSEWNDFAFDFKTETFSISVENTGIMEFGGNDMIDTGEREVTLAGVLIDYNARLCERKLNRKVLVV